MVNHLNQRLRVIEQFKKHGKISRNYAIHSMFITRLGALIFDLRADGWDIETIYTTKPNDCIYRLVKNPKTGEPINWN